MLRSLMTAVTGVKAHQTMLDVTGNNVANVNTAGFKRDVTVFQDLLYQTTQGATAPGNGRGGIDPSQVGLGVAVAAIETVHSQGGANYTGQRTDMMVQGEGYFVFSDGMKQMYSRSGNFIIDGDSMLTHSGTGYRVQGYAMTQNPLDPTSYDRSTQLSDMRIAIGSKIAAKETNLVGLRCNLNSTVKNYLPMGYEEGTTTKSVTFANGVTYDVEASTTKTYTANNATTIPNYLQYTITDPNDSTKSTTISLTLNDIKDGVPQFDTATIAIAQGTGGHAITGITAADISYNNTTGGLKITGAVGGVPDVTLWETNVHEKMDYTPLSVTDSLGNQMDFLMEFQENPLDGSTATAVFTWKYTDATTSAVTYGQTTQVIPLKIDGTFDIPDEGLDISAGAWPGIWGGGPAGTVAGSTLVLKSSANGAGVQIEAAKTAAVAGVAARTAIGGVQQNPNGIHNTKFSVYDCQGNAHTMEVSFKKISANNWRVEVYFPDEPDLYTYKPSFQIEFGPCGKIISVDGQLVDQGAEFELDVPFSLTGSMNSKIKLDLTGKAFGFDDPIEGVTQFGSPTTTKAWYQDGYAMGTMTDFSVGKDGVITGIYSNGKNVPLYTVALALFANPMGLEKVGSTMFSESTNSGMAQIGAPQEGGVGSILGSNLEMSNVDLTEEFTKLILAQRGFQANARIVTTSDSILEEVVNLKR